MVISGTRVVHVHVTAIDVTVVCNNCHGVLLVCDNCHVVHVTISTHTRRCSAKWL